MDKRYQINLITTKKFAGNLVNCSRNFNHNGSNIICELAIHQSLPPLIGVSTITYDAFDNGNVFLFTLPFTRKEYAMEKYLFTLFLGAVATIGGILLVIVVMMAKGAFSVNAEEILITVLINIPSLLIFQAIFLPVQLKYEGEKGRIVVIGAVIVIVVFLFRMLEMAGIDLLDIILNHMYLKDTTLWVSTYIISIVVWLLSFIISERIVLKKEF